eukprot:5930926-Pleurochrysis_carterae.AAC.1
MRADHAALSGIRHRYGERSERLIAMLLTFDALYLSFEMSCAFDSTRTTLPSEMRRPFSSLKH